MSQGHHAVHGGDKVKTLAFFACGTPKGQPRGRAVRRGAHAGIYDPGTADNWKLSVRAAAKELWDRQPFQGPIRVSITAFFPRPKSHFYTGKRAGIKRDDAPEYHTGKPDRDNLDKAILDALTNAGIWKDDAQVCAGCISKRYADTQTPGAYIEVSNL